MWEVAFVWIFLIVLLSLAVIFISVLALPVYIIIKSDEKGEPQFSVKILFKTFNGEGSSDSSASKSLKELLGADRLSKKKLKEDSQKDTLNDTISLLIDFIKELSRLLKHVTAKRFEISAVCHGDDAADAAKNYGRYCAVIYPAAGLVASLIKVKSKGQKIEILCDYSSGDKDSFQYDFVLSVRVFRLLGAFLRLAIKKYRLDN